MFLQEQELVKETDRKHYPVGRMMQDVLPLLLDILKHANYLFQPPVIFSEQVILVKLTTGWEDASDCMNNKMKKRKKDKFLERFDKMFDVLKCKCDIPTCEQNSCSGCQEAVHISCVCPKEMKIPKLELAFIRAQRIKTGDLSSHRIAGKDTKESHRQNKLIER